MGKTDRAKNAARNMVFGMALKIYQILTPFLMRTAMIYLMGVQYLGLNSLFASILQVLNMTELGVGSAMVYSMYKPIAEDDREKVCALMKLYRTYYTVIGLVIAVVGGVLTPFVPKLISGELPENVNVYALYLLNLGATVLSYWLFAYKNSILQAYQRSDVVSKVTIVVFTIQYALQFAVLFLFRNYYLYVIVMLAMQVVTNIATAMLADKLYPQYKPKGTLSRAEVKSINGRIRDLFTSKLGSIVYDSADTMVISAFLGLSMLAIYQNYFYILSSVSGMITVVFNACRAGIGNSIVTETKEKNFSDFKKFTLIIFWIASVCSCCFLCLYQPFMELWVGKDLMLSMAAVVCFTVYFFVRQFNSLFNLYKDASGMWHEDKYRPLAAALTNLALNLILVQVIGIYGILLSTVLAVICVGMPWLLHNLFSAVFERERLKEYLLKLMEYCFVALLNCAVTYWICRAIAGPLVLTVLLRGLVCAIIPNIICYLLYRNSWEYVQVLSLVDHMTKGKLRFLLTKLEMDRGEP